MANDQPKDLSGVSVNPFAKRYDNFIGGKWVAPRGGRYFDNVTPITGGVVCQIARSGAEDIEAALDAAHAAKDGWGNASTTERANALLKIADRMEANLERLAIAETWDNGKPIRETMAADVPLAIDHFRYFAGVLRAQEGGISEIDADTIAYHFHEPLGVVGQIIPWNFSILMAAWKLAPALAAGNCVVLKPAEQTPAAIMVLAEIVADILPAGDKGRFSVTKTADDEYVFRAAPLHRHLELKGRPAPQIVTMYTIVTAAASAVCRNWNGA